MCLLAVGVSAQITRTGIIHRDGTVTEFTPEEAANVVLIGSSGLKKENHFQLSKLGAVVGSGRVITPDGRLIQLTPGMRVIHIGPSGVVYS